MKLDDVLNELSRIRVVYGGEIEVQLQNNPLPSQPVIGYESFFIVPEEYAEGEMVVNIRTWPY